MGGKKSFINKALSDVGKAASDVTSSAGKALGDTLDTAQKVVKDTSRQVGRLDKIILSPTNAAEESAKDEAQSDERQRERALEAQKQQSSDLRRQAASNESTGGSNIILGKQGKKGKKGGSVSSGLGLSKGKTGLQT